MRGLWLLLFVPTLLGFTPYEHEGSAAVVVDGVVVRGRALFSTEAASNSSRVVVYTDFRLPSGTEGYLTLEIPLADIGTYVPADVTYYEKSSSASVTFDGQASAASVMIGDRYSYGDETSLYIEFDLSIQAGGGKQRHLASGWAVTAPSPSILRTQGRLPDGVVVIDDGSGAWTGRAYDRGSVDCYGYPSETVLVESYHEDYRIVDDESNGGTDSGIDGVVIDPPDNPPVVTDPEDPQIYDPITEGDGYSTTSDSPGCNDRDTTTDDTTNASDKDYPSCKDSDSGSSSSSKDSGCSGDAEASTGGARFTRFHRGPPIWARRVLQLAPLFLGLALLLVTRRRPG